MPSTSRSGDIVLLVVICACLGSACAGGVFGREYEYEEEIRLSVDGAARVDLHASIAALVALRGVDLNARTDAPVDRDQVRRLFEGPGAEVTSVRTSRRAGRWFVHVRLDVEDIRQLGHTAPFSWSTYEFEQRDDLLEYRQRVGASSNQDVDEVGWTGQEIVAFRLHVPSRIPFHNAPSKEIRRGNILEWEQPLAARLEGVPLDIHVQMEPESILYTTLLLFGAMIALAIAGFAAVIWWLTRRGRDDFDQPAAGRLVGGR